MEVFWAEAIVTAVITAVITTAVAKINQRRAW